jgi:hypothetical protein
MTNAVVARWQDWEAKGIEHLVLREGAREIVAESVVIASTDSSMRQVLAREERGGCRGRK